MALQLSVAVRSAMIAALEATVGTSAVMKLRTGAAPANVAEADTGTVLATLNLPSDWLANVGDGAASLLGSWQDASADASGTIGHFRIYQSNGTTAHAQGSAGTSGTNDMITDTATLTAGQQFNVTSFTLTMGGA